MECPWPGYVLSGLCPVRVVACPGYVLSGLCPVQVMSCQGYVLSGLWESGLWTSGLWVSGLWESGLCPSTLWTASAAKNYQRSSMQTMFSTDKEDKSQESELKMNVQACKVKGAVPMVKSSIEEHADVKKLTPQRSHSIKKEVKGTLRSTLVVRL